MSRTLLMDMRGGMTSVLGSFAHGPALRVLRMTILGQVGGKPLGSDLQFSRLQIRAASLLGPGAKPSS